VREVITSMEGEYRKYKTLAELAMGQLREAELAQSPASGGNSVVNLVWHLAGNLKSRFTDFLETDGEKPWRDKDDEFRQRLVSRGELMEKWDDGWSTLFRTLETLTDGQLTTVFVTIRGEKLRLDQALLRSLTHAGYHSGQIVFLAKEIRGSSWKGLKSLK
jgi:uncharacterized damage-inducible protein DinB